MKNKYIFLIAAIFSISNLLAGTPDLNNDSNKPSGSPAIKGLYLGMKISDAIEVLKKLNNIDNLEVQRANGFGKCICKHLSDKEVSESIIADINNPYSPAHPIVNIDENNNANKITLSGLITSEYFGTGSLSANDFAKKVLDSYNIPKLEPTDDGNGWKYVSDKGWSITVGQDHSIILSKEDVVKKMD